MPSIEDALRLAERYARTERERTGKTINGLVEEFEHGWVIWTTWPEADYANLGQGKTVLDREHGQLTVWPSWDTATIAQEYAAQRRSLPPRHYRTLDLSSPVQVLLLDAVRTAVLAGRDGRRLIQNGVVLDEIPEHHPLMAEWLAAQPPGSIVQGAERHATLWVISEALPAYGPDALRQFAYDTHRAPCATCNAALVHFGIIGERMRAFHAPRPGDITPSALTFPDGRAFDPTVWAGVAFEILEKPNEDGYRIPRMEAARRFIESHPAVSSPRTGPGNACWVSPFHLGIHRGLRDDFPLLRACSALIGAALYPLGRREPHGVIAVDEHGRLFLLDEGGMFYCGRDLDDAMRMFIDGDRLPRVRQDGGLDT